MGLVDTAATDTNASAATTNTNPSQLIHDGPPEPIGAATNSLAPAERENQPEPTAISGACI